MYKTLCFIFLFCQFHINNLSAQQTANEYLANLNEIHNRVSVVYLNYISEAAHGNSIRKLEKKREAVVNTIKQTISEVNRIKPYQNDAKLKSAYSNYYNVSLKVFNEDYGKLINMEEVAEQSYDQMEAYLLAREKANEVLNSAGIKLDSAFNSFAAANNITIVENESKISRKLEAASKVNQYYDELFLIFFKSSKQEMYLVDAFNRNDFSSFEQNRITLQKYSEEGLEKLKTAQSFYGDGSLINNCRRLLDFFLQEANEVAPKQGDYIIKSENFKQIEKKFSKIPKNQINQDQVDAYNKAVNEMNEINKTLTPMNNKLNTQRAQLINQWNSAVGRFLDNHTPKQ